MVSSSDNRPEASEDSMVYKRWVVSFGQADFPKTHLGNWLYKDFLFGANLLGHPLCIPYSASGIRFSLNGPLPMTPSQVVRTRGLVT